QPFPHAPTSPLSLRAALPISPSGGTTEAAPAPITPSCCAGTTTTTCTNSTSASLTHHTGGPSAPPKAAPWNPRHRHSVRRTPPRSEEHTSELQSRFDLVCRLL